MALEKGDTVTAQLRADLVDDDYMWRWDTQVMARGDARCVKARFRQSTFYGGPIALEALKRREAGFVPPLTEAAMIDHFILAAMDGSQSLGQIAASLSVRFQQRFPRWQDALTRVADLTGKYSQ